MDRGGTKAPPSIGPAGARELGRANLDFNLSPPGPSSLLAASFYALANYFLLLVIL